MGKASIIVISEEYNQLAHVFYTYLIQLGYSPHSCRNKWIRIKEFFQYAETAISTDITAISTNDILNYYKYLQERPSKKNGQPLSQKTVVDNIRMIQQLYGMLQAKNQIQINPVNTINLYYSKEESPITVITQEEIKELYSVCKTYQEKAILALAYGCGLRVSELVQCNIEDIKVREAMIVVPKGKGNKGRIVPMSKTVMKDVSDYFYKERLQQDSKDPKAFIIHSKLRRMKTETYNNRLKKLIIRTENPIIKSKQITIHTLRHSIATHLIEQGVPLERVREFLGHSQLETTEIYTHISQKQLQKLVE